MHSVVDVQIVQMTGRELQTLKYLWQGDKVSNVGDLVWVPMGKNNKLHLGIVTHVQDRKSLQALAYELKVVQERIEQWRLRPETVSWAQNLAEYNLISLGMVFKLILPFEDILRPGGSEIKLLRINPDVTKPENLTIKQGLVWQYVQDHGPIAMQSLMKNCNVSADVVRRLRQRGLISVVQGMQDDSDQSSNDHPQQWQTVTLSAHQQRIYENLVQNFQKFSLKAQLLRGLPGSGKTEVYVELIRKYLKEDKQVLVLLPEIMLAEIFYQHLQKYFGTCAKLWHGQVSKKKKKSIWQAANGGDRLLLIGTRSSLFVPFKNLGLIVVDEEHDCSYKQEDFGACYHARDSAVWRGVLEGASVLLVSATPSVETMYNVQQNKYHQECLEERFLQPKLPDVSLVDMASEKLPWGEWISETLCRGIEDCLQQKNQVLLFLNRRGYAPVLLCSQCRFRFCCQHCDSWLVVHRFTNNSRTLKCHYCDFSHTVFCCPQCKNEKLQMYGPGVNRIRDEIRRKFPQARTMVISSDHVRNDSEMQNAIESIMTRECDVIIGTQIIAKGYNFPDLTLVGLLDADLGLSGTELRATEQNFQLIFQVAGRAGRLNKPGRVMVQTFYPTREIMQYVLRLDQEAFYSSEIQMRKRTGMPPVTRLVLVTFASIYEDHVTQAVKNAMKASASVAGAEVWGPYTPYIARVKKRFYRQILWRANKSLAVQQQIREWLLRFTMHHSVQVKINVDPYNILT